MVRVDVFQALVICGGRPLPVPAEAAAKQREEPGGRSDGVATHLLHGRPDGPLDEDPGKAGHAEKHRDGHQDVGDEAEQHGGPVDLNTRSKVINKSIMNNDTGRGNIWQMQNLIFISNVGKILTPVMI